MTAPHALGRRCRRGSGLPATTSLPRRRPATVRPAIPKASTTRAAGWPPAPSTPNPPPATGDRRRRSAALSPADARTLSSSSVRIQALPAGTRTGVRWQSSVTRVAAPALPKSPAWLAQMCRQRAKSSARVPRHAYVRGGHCPARPIPPHDHGAPGRTVSQSVGMNAEPAPGLPVGQASTIEVAVRGLLYTDGTLGSPGFVGQTPRVKTAWSPAASTNSCKRGPHT